MPIVVQVTLEDIGSFFTKMIMLSPCDPMIMLLAICPMALKTYILAKSWTLMFPAALFIISRTQRKPRCPSIGEWINKAVIHPDNVILFSAVKKQVIKLMYITM
jgi:hypothetical protein